LGNFLVFKKYFYIRIILYYYLYLRSSDSDREGVDVISVTPATLVQTFLHFPNRFEFNGYSHETQDAKFFEYSQQNHSLQLNDYSTTN